MKTALSLALLLGPAALHAAESLEPVVVTATGYPVKLSELPASVDLITRQEIEERSATDLADLLRFHTGLEIGRNGGPGQVTALFIRGTESDHALVMIDGVPIQSGSVGSAAIQHIDPRLVERIEIHKGPRSTLWGSGAIGGVVNIITRRGGEGADWGASLELGGDDTTRAAARASWNGEGRWLAASVSHQETDGFPPQARSDLDRGYRNTGFDLSAGIEAGGHELALSHWQARGNNEYLGFFGAPLDQDFLNSASALGWTARFTDRWQSLVEVTYVRDYIDQNQSDDFVHTDRTGVKWENRLELAEGDLLTLGYRYSRESVEAFGGWTPYDIDSDIQEGWLQYDLSRGAHHLIAGLRHIDHEDAGRKTTWSLNYGYRLTENLHLYASAGTAFRVPSANERYGFGGNPDLEPEESTGYEAGFRFEPAPGHLVSGSIYRNDLKNLIQWVMVTPPFTGFNRNVAQARIDGMELAWDHTGPDLDLHLGWNLQNPVNRDDGSLLLRRARYSVDARFSYRWSRFRFGADLLHSGPREDFGGVELESYTLINLHAGYRLAEDWELHATLENAFDETYELASGFNTAGRTAYVGIRYR